MNRASRLLLLAALATTVALGAAPVQAQLKPLRITIPVESLTFYPIFVAQDKGFFRQEGYTFEIIVTQGDGPDVDALIAGSVEFTATPPHRLLSAYEQGKPLLAVVNLMNRNGINCFMNKAVADRLAITEKTPLAEKLKKLKGLTIGATRPGAFTYQLATHYVKRAGLEPQKDVKIIGAGGGPAMLAAVENNKIDIGCISSPTPELGVHRGKAIMWINNTRAQDPEFTEFLMETLYVRPDWARQNADTVRAVARALVKALRFIADGPESEHMEILKARFKAVPDDVLKASLVNTRSAVDPTGRINQKGVDANVKFLKEAGLLKSDIPWTAVTTNEYLPK